MIQLVPFLACGVLLLGVVSLWALREYRKSRRGVRNDTTEEQLSTLRFEISAGKGIAERVFALEDWEFVSREPAPEIQRLLDLERRAVAILWLKRTRRQVAEVMRLHKSMVRHRAELSVTNEAKLLLEYYLFFPTYYLLLILIWLRGPFRTRQMVGYSVRKMSHVMMLLEKRLNVSGLSVGVPKLR